MPQALPTGAREATKPLLPALWFAFPWPDLYWAGASPLEVLRSDFWANGEAPELAPLDGVVDRVVDGTSCLVAAGAKDSCVAA